MRIQLLDTICRGVESNKNIAIIFMSVIRHRIRSPNRININEWVRERNAIASCGWWAHESLEPTVTCCSLVPSGSNRIYWKMRSGATIAISKPTRDNIWSQKYNWFTSKLAIISVIWSNRELFVYLLCRAAERIYSSIRVIEFQWKGG